ncbi:DUF2130 domain-containing protein [Mesorhizobium sp. M0991]|uniref:DUF2130 domain-containing protein n=1 Tax=Mesorhizobium sp. M0991 TaxID=2957043 RepID=UPI003336BF3B
MIDIDKDWLSSQYSLRFDAIELVVDGVNRTYRARAAQKYFYLRLYRASGRPLSQIIAEVTLLTQFPDRADVGVSEMALTIERKIQEGLDAVRVKARSEAEDGLKMKVAEKEEQIAGMQRQIEELKRRAEQGSQQLQGEVLELELESLIASRFPMDTIEPVAKGEFGGDVLHRVVGPAGQPCGAILWESKRTKNWTQGWLGKLRGDQRAAKADIALMISEALPPGVETFDLVDGVYVAHPKCAIPIAIMLRQSLIKLANSRLAQDGQATKMEQVYGYLTGPRFRHRVEAIVEKFSDMQEDLAKERKVTTRLWAKREAQIQGVIESTVGMYGDLQGIAGKVMQEIEGLDVLAIEAASPETE